MKTKCVRTWSISILILTIFVIFGIINAHTHTDTIKIGGTFPLTGDASTVTWGEAARNGAELAAEDINAAGGINGKNIEIVSEDMRGTSQGSISAVTKLISIDHVRGLLVSWLDVYQGAAPYAAQNSIPMISPDGGIEAINGTTINKDVFSTWYRTDVKAQKVVAYMAQHGVRRLGYIVQNDAYYSDFIARVSRYAAQNDISIVAAEKLDEGVADIRTQAMKVASMKPDAIMFALYDDKQLYNFLSLHAQLFPAIPLYGDELVEDHYRLERFAGLYEHTVYFHAAMPTPDFVARYHAKFGTDPVFGAGPAYDAVMILAKTWREKGFDVDYDTYFRETTFDTVSYGNMTFDTIGGVQTKNNQFDLWRIENGKAMKIQ